MSAPDSWLKVIFGRESPPLSATEAASQRQTLEEAIWKIEMDSAASAPSAIRLNSAKQTGASSSAGFMGRPSLIASGLKSFTNGLFRNGLFRDYGDSALNYIHDRPPPYGATRGIKRIVTVVPSSSHL